MTMIWALQFDNVVGFLKVMQEDDGFTSLKFFTDDFHVVVKQNEDVHGIPLCHGCYWIIV
jgi:hypothetical protein